MTGDESSTMILGVTIWPASDTLAPLGEESRDFGREDDDEAEEFVTALFEDTGLLLLLLSLRLLGDSDRRGELAPEDVADDLADETSTFCCNGATTEGADELALKLAAFVFAATVALD